MSRRLASLYPKITTHNCIHLNTAWPIISSLFLANSHILIQPISNNLHHHLTVAHWDESNQCRSRAGEAWRLPHFPSSQHSVLFTLPI